MIEPPTNAHSIDTIPASDAEKAKALASGYSFTSGWVQLVASFRASHPIVAVRKPSAASRTGALDWASHSGTRLD